MFEDKDVGDFVQFWEYSAILDERTTDYCKCMNGKIFRKEDIAILNPPAHFNCRSIPVPITQFEVDELIGFLDEDEDRVNEEELNNYENIFMWITALEIA